ncbi:MAG: hypothetical protein ABI551_07030, partial [Polyangiaceae bacterium]
DREHDPDGVTMSIDRKNDADLSAALEKLDNLEAFNTAPDEDSSPVLEANADELEVVGGDEPEEPAAQSGGQPTIGEDTLTEEEEAALAAMEADETGGEAPVSMPPPLPDFNDEASAPRAEDVEDLAQEEEEETRAIFRPNLSSLPPAPALDELEAERPAHVWLEEHHGAEVMERRATWLEEEARAIEDAAGRARALLVVSEMRAMLAQRDAAHGLAREAAQIAPAVALAHRQSRSLLETRDAKTVAESVAAAAAAGPTPAAALHDALYAADVARIAGDTATTRDRIDDAAKLAPADIRVVTLRATLALAAGDITNAALTIDPAVCGPLAAAAADAVAVRGGTTDSSSAVAPILALRRARGAVARGQLGAASEAVGELTALSDLEASATWLAATLAANDATTRPRAAKALRALATADDSREGSDSKGAARTLAIRGIEVADSETVHAALEHPAAFSADERLALRLLIGDEPAAIRTEMANVAGTGADALLATAAAIAADGLGHQAGNEASKRGVALGHLLGHAADFPAIEAAVDARLEDSATEMKMLKLDIARRSARWTDVSSALSEWGQEGALERGLAAALVA